MNGVWDESSFLSRLFAVVVGVASQDVKRGEHQNSRGKTGHTEKKTLTSKGLIWLWMCQWEGREGQKAGHSRSCFAERDNVPTSQILLLQSTCVAARKVS